MKGLKERIRSRLSVSVAEVGGQHLLHRGELGIAMVSDSQDTLEAVAQKIRSLIESRGRVEILNAVVDFHRYP